MSSISSDDSIDFGGQPVVIAGNLKQAMSSTDVRTSDLGQMKLSQSGQLQTPQAEYVARIGNIGGSFSQTEFGMIKTADSMLRNLNQKISIQIRKLKDEESVNHEDYEAITTLFTQYRDLVFTLKEFENRDLTVKLNKNLTNLAHNIEVIRPPQDTCWTKFVKLCCWDTVIESESDSEESI